MEVWKDIRGYEGLYEVSNWGRVKSVERVVIRSNGIPYTVKEKMRKPTERNDGHLQVVLSKNGVGEPNYVHVLVATAFIPNQHNYTVVHHINENPLDNRVENLMWISDDEHRKLHAKEQEVLFGKRVDQIDSKTGEVLRQWDGARNVERELGYSHGNINSCCNGGFYSKSRGKWINVTQAYDFVWKKPRIQ